MTCTATIQLTTVSCGCCGGVYAIAESYHERARKERTSWTCPYCEAGWGFEHLRKKDRSRMQQLEDQRDRMANQLAVEKRRHRHTEAQRRAEKGHKTRLQKRAKGGACPCCNRTFTDLQRHMASKHPDFAGGEVAS